MIRKLEASLKDLRRAKLHMEQAAACLFNIVINGEGGDDIKALCFDFHLLVGAFENIQENWESKGA